MDYLAGAEGADLDLTGSGKKKKKHKSVRARKRWAAIHAARAKRAAAAQAAYGFDPQALFPGIDPAGQGIAMPDAGQTFGQAMAGVPLPFMQQAPGQDYGAQYEAIGGYGMDEGGGPQGGARVLDYAGFDDLAPTPLPQRPVEIDLDDDDLAFEVEGGAGLPFMQAVMGAGCGCETYRRYPRRSGIRRPF
jgi:hypothetical protein